MCNQLALVPMNLVQAGRKSGAKLKSKGLPLRPEKRKQDKRRRHAAPLSECLHMGFGGTRRIVAGAANGKKLLRSGELRRASCAPISSSSPPISV
jgi:hypothetical protein